MQNHGRRHLVSEISPYGTMYLMVPSETKWLPNASSLVHPGLYSRHAKLSQIVFELIVSKSCEIAKPDNFDSGHVEYDRPA